MSIFFFCLNEIVYELLNLSVEEKMCIFSISVLAIELHFSENNEINNMLNMIRGHHQQQSMYGVIKAKRTAKSTQVLYLNQRTMLLRFSIASLQKIRTGGKLGKSTILIPTASYLSSAQRSVLMIRESCTTSFIGRSRRSR